MCMLDQRDPNKDCPSILQIWGYDPREVVWNSVNPCGCNFLRELLVFRGTLANFIEGTVKEPEH